MRSTLALLSLAAMLAGCPRSSDNGGSPPQTLDACLTKWWRGYYGACDIMPECSGATGELQQACAAADCHWMAFSGYRSDGTTVDGNAIWSSARLLLCAKDIQSYHVENGRRRAHRGDLRDLTPGDRRCDVLG